MSGRATSSLAMRAVLAAMGFLARVVSTTWRTLGCIWKCRRPCPDPLEWTFRLRDFLGVAVLVAVTLIWRTKDFDPSAEFNAAVTGRFTAVLVLIAVVPGTALAFALIARRGLRLRAWSLSAIPIVAVVTTVAVVAGPGLLFQSRPWYAFTAWISNWLQHVMENGGLVSPLIVLALGLLTMLASLVQVTATLAAVIMSFSSSFRAGDAHPMMASVVGIALALYTASAGVWQRVSGADASLPLWVAWTITLGGPAAVIALSGWQIVRLRAIGLRFRVPPWPVDSDPIARATHRMLLAPSAFTASLHRSRPSRRRARS